MNLFKTSLPLKQHLEAKRGQNMRIGFVPTMGALHAGHISLIEIAKQHCDIVVCSIFVNPTQFNNPKDLELYPKPLAMDIQLLIAAGCDVLFHPEVEEVYKNGLDKESAADYGNFIHVLEGAHRPGHFDGVVTIVKRLFSLVQPDEVFFGQKDYQQCLVVKTLINREFPKIVFNQCPILREVDGLAMSSRNIRLSVLERKTSSCLFKALNVIKQNWNQENWMRAKTEAMEVVKGYEQVSVTYLSISNADTLEECEFYEPNAVALIAAQFGETRLIDNVLLD